MGGPRMLRLAARHADIVGVLPAPIRDSTDGDPRDRLPAALDAKISLLREAAGDRFGDIEISALATFVVTDRRRADTDYLIARRGWGGFDAETVWDMPAIFIGNPDQIRADLYARRERFGLSNLVVGEDSQSALAEIISGLQGRHLNAVAHRTTMDYMNHPLSVRLNDATITRLGKHAQRAHLAPRTLAQRYVEEGLRMDEHPLVRFTDGPAGRRARLMGTGKDVWEVIATVRDNDGDASETAGYLEIPLGLVQAAITYYGAYQDEIDQWIEMNDQEAAEARAAWMAGQAAVKR